MKISVVCMMIAAAGLVTACQATDSGTTDGGATQNQGDMGTAAGGTGGGTGGNVIGNGGTNNGGTNNGGTITGGTDTGGTIADADAGTGGAAGGGSAGGGSLADAGAGGSGGGVADCAAACQHLGDCSTSSCDALDPAAAASFADACAQQCAANQDAFIGIVNAAASCGELVDQFSQLSTDYCALCHGAGSDACGGGGGGDVDAACQAAAEQLAGCTVEQCAPLSDYQAGFVTEIFYSCQQDVAQTPGNLAQYQQIGGATCQQLGQIVTSIINGGQGGGTGIAAFCAGTPARDPAECTTICGEFTTCAPDQDPASCLFPCVASADASTVMDCIHTAGADCAAMQACFN